MKSDRARLVIRVQPNTRQNKLTGFKDGVLQVRIAAPPVEGRANEALVKFLADCLGVSKGRINIEKGLTGRTKTIAIDGLSRHQAEEQLERLSE